MRIEEVDPADDGAFADWFAVVDDVAKHDRPGETGWLARELRAAALAGRGEGEAPPDERHDLLLARVDGAPVGAAQVELPLSDNRHVLGVQLHVRPQARRRGVGTALLEQAVRRGRDAGRTALMGELDEPPALEGRSPGRAFCTRHGLVEALEEVRRDLAVPVDPARLDALEAACAPHAVGYRVRTWRDRCPDDLLEDRAALGRTMSTDAPFGELSWQEESWDADRVRRREALLERQGRGMLGAGAVHKATGALVAFTEVAVPLAAPERVHQWETLVVEPHRGHRLGLLVKAAVLRRLPVEWPAARLVSTCNARSNAPMIAVNEALGFVPNGRLSSWERQL